MTEEQIAAISAEDRAEILIQALPYIRKYYNKIVVVKYGGNAMTDESLKEQVMEDIVLLTLVGIRVVLVHGGGPEINDLLAKLNIESKFVDGLRVTSAEAVEVVQMVLAGKVNKTLVNMLQAKGGNAVGIAGMDGRLIQAKQMKEELGYVGEVTNVNIDPIIDLLDGGYIPVVSTLGCDEQGNVYNINGDTAAAAIAGALDAERLIMMTNTPGIMRDMNDPSTLIADASIEEAEHLKEQGVISGGMIPKVNCCIDAINAGVKNVIIMDGRVPHSILTELLTDEGAGTMIKGA
jgi:acetylglutamate kinase